MINAELKFKRIIANGDDRGSGLRTEKNWWHIGLYVHWPFFLHHRDCHPGCAPFCIRLVQKLRRIQKSADILILETAISVLFQVQASAPLSQNTSSFIFVCWASFYPPMHTITTIFDLWPYNIYIHELYSSTYVIRVLKMHLLYFLLWPAYIGDFYPGTSEKMNQFAGSPLRPWCIFFKYYC